MPTMTFPRFLLCAALAGSIAGCKCNDATNTKTPKIELPSSDGMGERTVIDFGSVVVGSKAVAKLTVKNTGTASLELSKLEAAAPFGVDTTVPVSISAGTDSDVLVTLTPVAADQQVTGTLTITSSDQTRPTVTVQLKGQGVTAVAAVSPNPIAFGDVYLGENKKVTVTVVNQGSSPLSIASATLTGTVTGVTGDLSKLAMTVPAGGASVTTDLTFAPTTAVDVAGNLELDVGASAGGTVKVPLTGHATVAVPRLCFKRDDTGMETCTDQTAVSLTISLGSVCDTTVSTGCGDAGVSGQIYLRNEGNVPVSFSSTWTPFPYPNGRCDGGTNQSDYVFSNAPVLSDGGRPGTYAIATVKLPMSATDPKPWETTAITLRYRAQSHCLEDTSDDARILMTRQGDPMVRLPASLLLSFNARSLLPQAKGVDSTYSSTGAAALPFAKPFEVQNQGDAPLTIKKVELWQEFAQDGGFDAGGPTGGFFFACQDTDVGDCATFRWQGDAGDPNATPNQQVAPKSTKTVGTLVFAPGGQGSGVGQAQFSVPYSLYAVISTDDPYALTVLAKINAKASP